MNSNSNDKTNEIKYIDYQIIISIISIIVIIISITLLYNEQTYLKTKKYIIPPKSARNLSIFNRSLALFTAIAFLYFIGLIPVADLKCEKKLDKLILHIDARCSIEILLL